MLQGDDLGGGVKKASIEEGAMGSLFVLVHRGL